MIVKRKVQILLIALAALMTLSLSPAVIGKEIFLTLSHIKPGMNGVGYTVFHGTKVEAFNVKVVNVINGNNDDHLILVRLSGKKLEENGGLASGMSGSPVYIKGKLAGAISYGFENADPFLAMVTPIESMFKLLDTRSIETVLNWKTSVPGERLKPVPVYTPVMVSGMSRRSFEMIRSVLEAHQLKPVFLPDGQKESTEKAPYSVEPGSAIAVQLVSGDYQATAIGTVTWTGKDYFLAFGHPFMNKGKVEYNVFQAEVLQTVKSQAMAFKMGAAVHPIGKIIEDRHVGILGQFGDSPSMIEVEVNVKELDQKKTLTSRFRVVDMEKLYPDLIISGVTAAIDRTVDRVGEGTAKVIVKFQTAKDKEMIVKENLFFGKDIAVSCIKDVSSLLDIFADNEFDHVDLRSVKVDVQVEKAQTTARIIKLEADGTKVKPGATLALNAIVHTYRGSNFKVPFQVKIPGDIEPGKLLFTMHGGAEAVFNEKDEDGKKGASKLDYQVVDSLEKQLKDNLSAFKNNQLVLEYFPMLPENKTDGNEAAEPIRQAAETGYYILGSAELVVEVEAIK